MSYDGVRALQRINDPLQALVKLSHVHQPTNFALILLAILEVNIQNLRKITSTYIELSYLDYLLSLFYNSYLSNEHGIMAESKTLFSWYIYNNDSVLWKI